MLADPTAQLIPGAWRPSFRRFGLPDYVTDEDGDQFPPVQESPPA
jgi:hypothetical protein